jgi:hypothetical protein
MMAASREFKFVVRNWHAWVPGMKYHPDWRDWFNNQDAIEPEQALISTNVPKPLQRRLSPLARAVFNAAESCINSDVAMPIVLSSAHGEVNKSLEMLKDMQSGEDISPTAFSLSVHNAISGLFSIAHSNHQEITVLAPGQDGIVAAFIEALGLLQEGHDAVLVVLYDEPLSEFYPYLPFALTAKNSGALALKISWTGDGLPLLLCRSPEHRNDGEHALQIFSFLQFLVTDEQFLQLGNHRHSWIWQKK